MVDTALIGCIIYSVILVSAPVWVQNIPNPSRVIKLKKYCKKHQTSKKEFERQVYDAMPNELKRPFRISCTEPKYGGRLSQIRKRIRLSEAHMIDHLEHGYLSILDNHALCLSYGHELAHFYYQKRKMFILSKKNSIFCVMREIKADIDGRLFFNIPQEEAAQIMEIEGRLGKFYKNSKLIIKRRSHPYWADRVNYMREFPEYNAELEERIKRDYCRILNCPYEKVADITLLEK